MSIPATLEPPHAAAAAPALSPQAPWFTAEQLAELPEEDGVEREIVDGRLLEYPMSERSYLHTRANARVIQILLNWLDRQPAPRGDVLGGDASFRLRRNPDTTVGIDAAYVSPEQRATATPDTFTLEGAPVLAVEIYSPSDQHRRVMTKVRRYLDAGTSLVWLVDPILHTVTVHRPDAGPRILSEGEDLTAEPHLPGFRVPVAEIFA